MRVLGTLLKIVFGLLVAIPLGIVGLVLALGVLGSLFAFAIMALKLAFLGFVGYGLFRVARRIFAPAAPKPTTPVRELAPPDPYYQQALRELDREMGHVSAR